MDQQLKDCLENKKLDYILPFLWVKGEEQELTKREILAIKESGIESFCVESRTYEKFCEEKWWEDFRFILDTARELDMHVWLLDDKHFPTGYANGSLVEKYPHLRKKLVRCHMVDVLGPCADVSLLCDYDTEDGDRLLRAVAYRRTGCGLDCEGPAIDLTATIEDGLARFDIPDGLWRVFCIVETRKVPGTLPHHIDMLNPASTELMISEVYQPQYDHFAEYFGNTFCGFFSDEPGFGNETGGYYATLGKPHASLPWNSDLIALFADKLSCSEDAVWAMIPGLWSEIGIDTSRIRVAYMDTVTALYAKNFTEKIGNWCRAHKVEYIGHVIEDMGCCSRLGHGAGHFFRSLDAQSMAGIDVVLQQIIHGQNELPHSANCFDNYVDPAFFNYALAKLGASHCHINPTMENRAMCEIFGAFGYAEGLPFMKKLADHMLCNGINRYVPHAFTPTYPNPDCPPHFYSAGKNPQFELFGELMRYMQRVIHLLEGGVHRASALLYYNAECEWTGRPADFYCYAAKQLTQAQIDFDFASEDHLTEVIAENGVLKLNKETYGALVLPGCDCITDRLDEALCRIAKAGVPVLFCDRKPVSTASGKTPAYLSLCSVTDDAAGTLREIGIYDIALSEKVPYLRFYHTVRDGRNIYLLKNDSEQEIDVELTLKDTGDIAVYDPWKNTLARKSDRRLMLADGEMVIWIFGEDTTSLPEHRETAGLTAEPLKLLWDIDVQSVDDAAPYRYKTASTLFNLCGRGELKHFSGKAWYTAKADLPDGGDIEFIDFGFIGETVKLTLNGIDCGTLITAPYRFDVKGMMKNGENLIEAEVVTNPAYRERDGLSRLMRIPPAGILGPVKIMK